MKHMLLIIVTTMAIALPVYAEETWKNVPIIDSMCLSKVKDKPDEHQTKCLIQCAKGGYGVLSPEGTYLRFDDEGNAKALSALKKTKKKDHIRATVTGERQGDMIKVRSISLD